jgi:hypothetical protein
MTTKGALREKARLRSEAWRRAHGIMPRKPAQRPRLAEGVSRSTPWYRRRKQARERAALAAQTRQFLAGFARAESFVADLQRELTEAARCQAIAAGIMAARPADQHQFERRREGV